MMTPVIEASEEPNQCKSSFARIVAEGLTTGELWLAEPGLNAPPCGLEEPEGVVEESIKSTGWERAMRSERKFFSNGVLVLTGGTAILVIMLVAFLGTIETVPGQGTAVIAVLLAIFLLVVGMGIIMAPLASEQATEEMVGLAAAETATAVVRPELELMDAVPVAPLSPITLRVVGATGVCALGFRPGHTWVIGDDGHLSRPLCQPAVVAVSSMLRSLSTERVKQRAPCYCPLGNRKVEFAVQEEESAQPALA